MMEKVELVSERSLKSKRMRLSNYLIKEKK